jgi:hypothetical protein
MKYDYKQLHLSHDDSDFPFLVKGYKNDGHPPTSVCAGMTRIDFIDSYQSEQEAVNAHPQLVTDGEVSWGCAFLDKDLKDVSHIPDEPDSWM